jgi:hypothetical protein
MQTKVFGLPVDKEIMFSNHKEKYKPRVEKRQRKLITKISFLRPFLEPDENILLVTTGHSPPTVLEKIGIGWVFLYLKRSLLVFTDRRIFHVLTTSSYKYRNSIAHIPYSFCDSLRMKGASLLVNYKGGGGTEKFISLSGREKKKIRELLKMIAFEGTGTGLSRRTHLCPQCAAALYDSMSTCRSCELSFKTRTAATLLAILLPGGGYFYLRQPFLGAVEGFVEICAGVLIGVSIAGMLGGPMSNMLWLAGGILVLGLSKAFAAAHARVIVDEFVPKPEEITFQAA